MTVPAQLVGRSCFTVRDGLLCGLHFKSSTTVAVSVVQEPLRVALGTIRVTQLGELTNSSASHLPTLVSALADAFDREGCVSVVEPADPDLLPAYGSTDVAEDDLPPPATGLRVKFSAFSTDYDVTLRVKRCPRDAKDPLVWSLMMDLFRANLRVKDALRAANLVKPTTAKTAPTGAGAPRRPVHSPAPPAPWRSINTSRGKPMTSAVDTCSQVSATTHSGRRPATGAARNKVLPAAATPNSDLHQRALLEAQQQLALVRSVHAASPYPADVSVAEDARHDDVACRPRQRTLGTDTSVDISRGRSVGGSWSHRSSPR
jgi:hypothetical protein